MTSWTAPNTSDRPLAILGAGVLGQRIACVWTASGYDVNIYDPNQAQADKAREYVETNAATYPTRTKSTELGQLRTMTDLADTVKKAWLVIEAVPEKLQLKIDIFGQIAQLAPQDAILATNSSSYKSSEMLAKTGSSKSRVINMHYTMPPQVKLVELMTDGETQDEIFPFLEDKLKDVGMIPIRAYKESSGFVVNRVWAAIKRECLSVLAEGVCPPDTLDKAMIEMFGFHNKGPCASMDAVGLDTVALIEEHYVKERGLTTAPLDWLKENYVSKGKLGEKSGEGLYAQKQHEKVPSLFFLDLGVAAPPTEALQAGRVIAGSIEGDVWNVLVDHEALPDGIAISKRSKRLFWTLMATPGKFDGKVRSCNFDGSDVRTVVEGDNINTLKQIIVHDNGTKEQLYFCDREGMKVWRSDLDGSNLETLISSGDPATQMADQTRHIVGIAVSEKEQKFYWTQKGPSKAVQGRILRANLQFSKGTDANSRDDIEVVLQDLPEPIDLELDDEKQVLYWTDRGELPLGNTINRVKLSDLHPGKSAAGKRGQGYDVVARNLHEAIGLALDVKNRHIYSTDLGGSVYRFDMDADSVHQATVQEIYRKQGSGAFTGIALVS